MNGKKQTVGLLIENHKGEILVLHRNSKVPEGDTWGLIGGSVDNEDISTSLISKVKQEIGLELDKDELKKVKKFDWEDPKVIFHLYKLNLKFPFEVRLDNAGHSEYKWEYPKVLYDNYKLMKGLYKIIEEVYS